MYNGVYTSEQYAYLHDTLVKWLRLKVDGKSLGLQLQEKGVSRVIVYGANEFGQLVSKDLRAEVEVLGFADRKAAELRDTITEIPLYLPEEMRFLSGDFSILVTPEYYFREIADSLTALGIEGERILSLAMLVE